MTRLGRRLLQALVVTAVVAPLGALALVTDQLGGVSVLLDDVQYPTGPVDERLVVVELPPEAAGEWTRGQHAEVVDALARAGAGAVGYDVVFDRQAPGDDVLAASLAAAGNVVLAAVGSLPNQLDGDLPATRDVLLPTPMLLDAAAGVGNAEVVFSTVDNVARDVPLVAERPDRRLLPALSLATVLVGEGLDPGAITLRAGTGVSIGSRLVPTRTARLLRVNWALPEPDRPDGRTVLSAQQLLAGGVDLQGSIVLVGVDDPLADFDERGRTIDRVATPVDKGGMPGVYVHANAANTMLTNLFRRDGDATAAAALVAMVAVVAFAGMAVRLSLVPALALTLLLAWQAVVNLQFQRGLQLDNLWPNLAVLAAAAGVVGARYVSEERERRRVAGLFRQYVPDSVADDLLASDQLAAAAEGERTEVTVLFCDLRGFTATAATLPPADVRAMLEVYYDHSTRIIQDHGGTVMQFVGDEVFAVFGAPLDQPDHAQRALEAAVAMQRAAPGINAELASRGVAIAYGIGLNTGEVVAAHVGSQIHKQYAVVGQTVNVGARLCSKALPGGVVLSKWTRDALATVPELEPLGSVALKGVADDPEPARVLGLADSEA